MQVSLFIGKILGIYMLVTSIAMLFNQKYYKKVLDEISTNKSFFLISSIIALIFGLLIVISHNIWISNWQVIITIIGWLALVKGILLFFFPQGFYNFFKKIKTKYKIELFDWVKWWCLIALFVGAYLVYLTFFYMK